MNRCAIMGKPKEKIHKSDWEYKGDREEYTNRVMHYIIANGLQLGKFLADIEYKGIILPDKLIKGIKARLSSNPL